MKLVSLGLLALAALAGCGAGSRRPPLEFFSDMRHDGKYKPQSRVDRSPVPGTIARGFLNDNDVFSTGRKGGTFVGKSPLPLDRALLERGQERFNIYCAPCHDRTGAGQGIVATRGSWLAQNLTDRRIIDMPDGQLFDTITHGKRSMPGYRFQVGERDRWAIIAYVRALQRAAHGSIADVPPELRSDLR